MGAETPRFSAASIVKIEKPDEEEPFIPYAARMGAAFLHGAAVTIHKAQGSQWPEVQVFAPDLYAASRAGRMEAGQALWKRGWPMWPSLPGGGAVDLGDALTRSPSPNRPLGIADLPGPVAPLALEAEET